MSLPEEVPALSGRKLFGTVIIMWVLSLVAAVVVSVAFPPATRVEALFVTLALSVLATFVMQLIVGQRPGMVTRLAATLVGSFAIYGVAALTAGLAVAF